MSIIWIKKNVASENIIYWCFSEINSRKQIFNFSDARTVCLSPIWHLLKLVKPFPLCNWASPLCQPSWSWTTITVVSSVLRNMKLRSLNPLEHSNWRYNNYLFLKARGMVFCYQNCSNLLWEKVVLVIEKNFWNSRLKAE